MCSKRGKKINKYSQERYNVEENKILAGTCYNYLVSNIIKNFYIYLE